MAYVISYLIYLVAFLAGVGAAWVIARSQYPTLKQARASVRSDSARSNQGGSR